MILPSKVSPSSSKMLYTTEYSKSDIKGKEKQNKTLLIYLKKKKSTVLRKVPKSGNIFVQNILLIMK